MPKPSNERSLGEVIGDLIGEYGLREKLDALEVSKLWNEVAGETVARHTTRILLKRGDLFLELDSAPMRQEVSYMKDELRERINSSFGREVVKAIILR